MTSRFSIASITIAAAMTGNLAAGAKCGDPWREPCLSDSDIRYKSGSDYDLGSQNDLWEKFTGYYVCDMYNYGPDDQPLPRFVLDGVNGLNGQTLIVGAFPYKVFSNQTTQGTRTINHRYLIFPPVEGGTPFGVSRAFDLYATSSFELDGRALTLPIQSNFNITVDPFTDTDTTITFPVGDDTLFTKSPQEGAPGTFVTTSQTCIDEDCSTVREQGATYIGTVFSFSQGCTQRRITEQEFIDGVQSSFAEFGVPPFAQVQVPMVGSSATGFFPTEEQWCQFDPNCATNPYQEPTTPVKTGVIAGFTIGSVLFFLIVVAIAVYIYNKQQAKRYRAVFAARVAQTMSIRVPARRMDAAALAREFQKIDAQSTADKSDRRASSVGNITKEGMWEFLSSGKAVEMNRHDFEALWAVMDADGSGYVDFLEFCAFMGQCHEEYDNARDNRMLMAERLSRRFSMRLSQIEEDAAGQAADAAATTDPENPEGEEKEEDDVPSST